MKKPIPFMRATIAFEACVLVFVAQGSLRAQGAGPIKQPAATVARPPLPPDQPDRPPIPPEEIIRRFASKEDEFLSASANYNFQKSVRLEELGPGSKASGQVEIISEQVIGPDGRRYEKITKRTESTLQHMDLQRGDMGVIDAAPLFPLTTSQLPRYEITYQGKQPLDELSVYVFGVKPRALDRTHAYFTGVVWVDEQDLVVVKTIGKWVSETGDVVSPQLPFTVFETFREQVGKYWFPTYSRSEDTYEQGGASVPIRLTIRWTNYKLGTGVAPAVAPANAK
jgi:hypothetical protein